MALRKVEPSTETIVSTPDENAAAPRLRVDTGEDRELVDDVTPQYVDDRVPSGVVAMSADLIPLPLPDHLRSESPENLQVILSRAILRVVLSDASGASLSASMVEELPQMNRVQSLIRRYLPERIKVALDERIRRKSEAKAIAETRKRCDALAWDIIQEIEEVPGSGQRMLYFPQKPTGHDIAFSGESVKEVLTQMQEEPVRYIPSIDSQESDVVEILEWSSAEPTGVVYRMKFRNKKGEIKEEHLVATPQLEAQWLLKNTALTEFTKVLFTRTRGKEASEISIGGRVFYRFESNVAVNNLLKFYEKIEESSQYLTGIPVIPAEDQHPFGFTPSDSQHPDIFYAPSLDPEKNQQLHHYIWLGSGVNSTEIKGYVETIKNHEQFASRQGLNKTVVEAFPQGLAVRLPPYVDAKCVRQFKIHLMDYLK